jgi:cytochrome c-type biogenesis protein
MEDGVSLGVAIAFTAGLLSFLSPCVLPLIPSYVTFMTGMSLEDVQKQRRTAVVHALLFILGFTLVFLTLGATATVLGRLLLAQRMWIARVGGVLVILFGLYLLGVFNFGAFAREKRYHITDKPLGYLGTVVVGIAFGAGWTPCIGPILGGILTYTASQANLQQGLVLLFAYSMGLALPFFLAAFAIERFIAVFQRFRSKMIWVNRFAGAMLVVVGVLMMTNYLAVLSGYLQALTPEALRARL